MIMLLIYYILLLPLQIIGFVGIFSSQLGNSSVLIECFGADSCNELFTIYDNYQRDKYAFKVEVHKSKRNQIFGSFILGALPLVFFFIMVLLVSYIRSL